MRILLIEDDEVLADVLHRTLIGQNYAVDCASDGQLGFEYATGTTYDLIVMDVGLPRLDGISLCQRLRSSGATTPILLMTAKDATGDRIRGLDAGADDYLVKPLDIAEFQARVRALLRRGEVIYAPVLELGAMRLDPVSCQVTYAGKPLALTPKEYSLLELFLRNPTRVFSRGNIVEHLWTYDDPPLEESVKAHIKGLRQKLKSVGAVDWIENVYGLGYRLKQVISASETSQPPEHSKSIAADPSSSNHSQTQVGEVRSPHPPQSSVEQQFNQSMGQLWEQYQGLMTERVEVLQQVLTALQQHTLPTDLRQSAEQAAHKLAGVLGMFERDEGTHLAREIETLLAGNKPLSATEKQQLTALIQALNDSLNLTPTAPNPPDFDPVEDGVIVWAPPTLEPQPPLTRRVRAESVKVLAVDDDPIVLDALRTMLEPWGMQVTGLQNPLLFWTLLPTVSPDLVILDVEMPEMNGIDLCQAIRENAEWQGLPILFLTAHRDQRTTEEVFTAGADDYVIKPVVGSELMTRIINRLERTRLLQTLSTQDPLTGLSNQPQSSRELEQLLQQAETRQHPVCIALLRVADQRQINLQYGHTAGNQVLQTWGALLRSHLQQGEVLGYWGNSEFLVGMAGVNRIQASDRLSTLSKLLRTQIFTSLEGERFQAACHLAIAEYPADGRSLLALYQVVGRCESV